MGAKVIITIEGLDEVLNRLDEIGKKAGENVQQITQQFARDSEQFMQEVTPVRTGRLRQGDKAEAQGLSFTLQNGEKYYPFVSDGHMTPAGWHTRRGYRPAKRRSHVAGKHITEQTVQYIEENIEDRYSRFLDNV